jgi:hypothetical protein
VAFERATIAGMTDYTGVPFAAILDHLQEWERNTAGAADKLEASSRRISEIAGKLKNPREVASFCDRFAELFRRYAGDFRRLLAELPNGVRESHVKIIRQLYDSARLEDQSILRFRNDFVYVTLPDESARSFLDTIYSEAREVMIDFQDLSNLAPRLETFVGSERPKEVLTDLQLKPSFFGIGLNLNRIIARFWRR